MCPGAPPADAPRLSPLMEVIGHLPPRLGALTRTLFGHARPATVIVATPTAATTPSSRTPAGFRAWAQAALELGYAVPFKELRDEHPDSGAVTQVGVFSKATA